ncbi:MAG: hypothetical protein HRT88_14830 [Lentisphaeraceae bacterium]|nr:hypothetical protein [Lentisphaeraceae bacterium]
MLGTMLMAVDLAGHRVPMLTHEMFEKEQKNLAGLHHLLAVGEAGVNEAMLKGHKEEILLTYTVNAILEYDFLAHPQGELVVAVIQSINNVIEKNLVKK